MKNMDVKYLIKYRNHVISMMILNKLGYKTRKEKEADKRLKEIKIMAKYLDKTQDEWDDLVEKWNTDTSIMCSLQEYLELDDVEYLKFAHGLDDENISDKEVYEKSAEIAKNAVTELVIKPSLNNAIKRIRR